MCFSTLLLCGFLYKLRVYIRENIEVISSHLGFCYKSVPSLGFIDKELRMFGSQNGIFTDNIRFDYSKMVSRVLKVYKQW